MKETAALRALAADIAEGANNVKKSHSKDKQAAYSALKNLAFGQNVAKSRAKKTLSTLVNVGRKSMRKAVKERQKILSGEKRVGFISSGKQEAMQLARKTNSLFLITGHMKPADRQEIKKMF